MAKIYYSLYDRMLHEKGLLQAFRKVKSNQGKPGIDGQSIEDFAEHCAEEIAQLASELRNKSYRPKPVKRVEIPKDGGGKRFLGIPTVRDRVVQQALLNILQPIFDPGFHPSSYGYRPGRSPQQAVAKASAFIRSYQLKWVADMDLSRCFDTLNHDHILGSIRRKIADGSILNLLRMFLQSGVMIGERWQASEEGSPQGGVISPLIANIYLDDFDQFMKGRGHRIVRFADDSAPRRRTIGRKSCVQPCCTRDEGGPLEAAVQAEASNHPLLLPLREVVVSESGKGREKPCQVRTVESNASEPLMTCRKRRDDVKTGGVSLTRDQSGRNLSTAQVASGMKAARMRSRLLCGTWEPVTPMPREKRKWKPHKRESTDAGYRDGATRSSEEGSVMELERRGCPIRSETPEQLATGGLR